MASRVTFEELIRLPTYHQVTLSPGRDRLAVNWDPEGGIGLYVMDLRRGGTPRAIARGPASASPAAGITWMGDGSLLIAADLEQNERHTLFRISPDTGAVERLLGGDARYLLAPASPAGDEVPLASDRSGQMDLFILTLSDRSLRRLSSFAGPSRPGCWSPDGRWIYLAANDSSDLNNEDIYRVRRDGSGLERIFSSGREFGDRPTHVTPDGRALIITSDRSGFMQPGIFDLKRRAVRFLGDGSADETPVDLTADGSRILTLLHREARTHLVEIDLRDGSRRGLPLPPGVLSDGRYLWDGRILFGHSSPRQPRRLLASPPDGSAIEVLLEAESSVLLRDAFVDGDVVRLRSEDGLEIEALLYRPQAPPSGRTPAVVVAHGGPDLQDTLAFNPEVQALVGRGFTVLQVNYRGSTGHGREFFDLNVGDLGGGDAADVAAGARFLAQDPGIDPGRIVCAGGSYGGYLTYRALTRYPELWAGGAAWLAIADWTQLYRDSTPFLRHHLRRWFGGTPEEMPDRYRQASPIDDLPALRAPLLIIHGRSDPRVPVGQARNLRRRLIDAGRLEGRDFVYHELDVGHGTLEREARMAVFHLLARFLTRFHAGDPTRPESGE